MTKIGLGNQRNLLRIQIIKSCRWSKKILQKNQEMKNLELIGENNRRKIRNKIKF